MLPDYLLVPREKRGRRNGKTMWLLKYFADTVPSISRRGAYFTGFLGLGRVWSGGGAPQ